MQNIIGITRKSITANMKKLQENGLIKRIGADKTAIGKLCNHVKHSLNMCDL